MPLNGDLLIECLVSTIRNSSKCCNENLIPLQDFFYLLQIAEKKWSKERGIKPSVYLAKLLDYHYLNDSLLNAYKIFGVLPTDTRKTIKAAHRKLVIRFHPDSSFDYDKTEEFMKIQKAYELILHQFS